MQIKVRGHSSMSMICPMSYPMVIRGEKAVGARMASLSGVAVIERGLPASVAIFEPPFKIPWMDSGTESGGYEKRVDEVSVEILQVR